MTIWASGEKLTAAKLNSFMHITVEKTTQTGRSSTTTTAVDPDLVLPLLTDYTYDFRFQLYLSSATNAAGDWKGNLAFPSGALCTYSGHSVADTLASSYTDNLTAGPTSRRDTTSPGLDLTYGCSTSGTLAVITGRITMGSTAGDLSLYWAQSSSNANETRVLEGSAATAWRVY